jgi:hypothetical protein
VGDYDVLEGEEMPETDRCQWHIIGPILHPRARSHNAALPRALVAGFLVRLEELLDSLPTTVGLIPLHSFIDTNTNTNTNMNITITTITATTTKPRPTRTPPPASPPPHVITSPLRRWRTKLCWLCPWPSQGTHRRIHGSNRCGWQWTIACSSSVLCYRPGHTYTRPHAHS